MTKETGFDKHQYIVNGRSGYNLTTALRLWKTKYENDFRDFQKDVITHESLKEFEQFVKECWDSISPFTVQDAFEQTNTEDRRVFFDSIGIQKLFNSLEPKLLDKQVVKKKRARWDETNTQYEHEFEDVYELYRIDGEKLFGDNPRTWHAQQDIYAVRCWCTTTNREYWLYVTKEAALGSNWWRETPSKPDAVRAIAWTIRVDVPEEHLERIYRQGDIVVVKIKDGSPTTFTDSEYHLTKDQYLSLMYSET